MEDNLTVKKRNILCGVMPWINCPDIVEHMLRTCSDAELFAVGIENEAIWNVVSTIMKTDCPVTNPGAVSLKFESAEPSSNTFAPFPVEMYAEVISHLNIRDLLSTARTCKFFRHECVSLLHKFMIEAFSRFGLDWVSVRFMLIHTNSILSGLFAHHLLFLGSHAHYLGQCKTVDIYTDGPVRAAAVGRYLTTATLYRETESVPDPTPKIFQSVYFRVPTSHPSAIQIAVHSCREQPRAAVFRQAVTSVFGWMSGDGVFVPYANLTFASKALVSHRYFPLNNSNDIRRLALMASVSADHGIQLSTFHQTSSDGCGHSETCPSVVRTCLDCTNFKAVYHNAGWVRGERATRDETGVAWCLGSKDCVVERRGFDFFVKTFNPNPSIRIDGIYMARLENLPGILL